MRRSLSLKTLLPTVVLSTLVALVTLTPSVGAAPVVPLPITLTSEADRHVMDGFQRLDSGNVGEAESAFRTAISLDPRQARAHAGLGLALLRRGQHLAAADHFRRAVALPLPSDLAARCYASLGMISDGQGQTEAAIRYVQRALREQPRAIYQALLARLYLGAKRLDEARDAALAARQQDPDSPGILAISGRIANAFGRHDEAIPLLKQAIQRDQDNSEIFYELGLAYLGSGALPDAEKWLIGSAELNERRARTFDALAHVFMLQQKRELAIRALQAKLQVDPEHRTVWPDLQAVETEVRTARDRSESSR